jgi:hypothetical protein
MTRVADPRHKGPLLLSGEWLDGSVGVLEFSSDEESRDIRTGAVLPDEVYVLQFSYGGSG